MSNSNIVVFLDIVGRTILGEFVSKDDTRLKVRNPVVLNTVPEQSGKLSIQLFPVFFKEFLADKTDNVEFEYPLAFISPSNIDPIDFRLQAQYQQMFNPNNSFVPAQEQATPPQSTPAKVVNLFEE